MAGLVTQSLGRGYRIVSFSVEMSTALWSVFFFAEESKSRRFHSINVFPRFLLDMFLFRIFWLCLVLFVRVSCFVFGWN